MTLRHACELHLDKPMKYGEWSRKHQTLYDARTSSFGDLSGLQMLVWLYLISISDRDGVVRHTAQDRIARELKIDASTAADVLTSLQPRFLEIVEKASKGSPTVYRLMAGE